MLKLNDSALNAVAEKLNGAKVDVRVERMEGDMFAVTVLDHATGAPLYRSAVFRMGENECVSLDEFLSLTVTAN